MSLIDISHLTFTYEGNTEPVFTDLTLSFDTNWKTGLVGRNGRGKSTLLGLLFGALKPDGGMIRCDAPRVRFPLRVENTALPAIEVMRGLTDAPDWQMLAELYPLKFTEEMLDRPYDTLSLGERTRLQLAALFLREGCYPLIDEPTNHLDAEGRALVADYLRLQRGFLLVSHDRAFLDACTDHTISINRASVEVQRGSYSSFAENRRRKDAFERAENEKLEKQVAHLKAASARTMGWSDAVERSKIGTATYDRGYVGAKSAKMMKRAKAIEKRRESAIEAQKELMHDIEYEESLKIFPLVHRARTIVEARELSLGYGEQRCFEGLSFQIKNGMRLAVTGGNGTGKSTLLKAIAGESDAVQSGTLRTASGLVLSYVPQDTAFLTGLAVDYARSCGVDVTLFLTILRKLCLPREAFERSLENCSDGQRKKVLLARSLSERAHLYVWDEPLNYIDLFSRIQLEELLALYKPTMVFVEHDRSFVSTIATDVLHLGER